jgi:hypothetical protein
LSAKRLKSAIDPILEQQQQQQQQQTTTTTTTTTTTLKRAIKRPTFTEKSG